MYTNLAFFFVYFGGKSSCLSDHPVCRRMRAVAAINITHGHAMLLLHAGILHPKILSGAMQKFIYKIYFELFLKYYLVVYHQIILHIYLQIQNIL